jgi:hypothetical protein
MLRLGPGRARARHYWKFDCRSAHLAPAVVLGAAYVSVTGFCLCLAGNLCANSFVWLGDLVTEKLWAGAETGLRLYKTHKYFVLKLMRRRINDRAVAIREKALGAEHSDLAWSLDGLGTLYRIHGQHGKAEPLFEQALAIREKPWA